MAGHRPLNQALSSTRKLTYDDFLLFPDDGQRHELIEGEHYVTPSPSTRHQILSLRLTEGLLFYQRAHPGGQLFYTPLDCYMTIFDIVEPDLLFVAQDQLDIITKKHVRGAPALVVEILSPSTRAVDRQNKLVLYDREGVREYWPVDPEADVLTVFRRADNGGFPRIADLSAHRGDTLTTPLLPGFSLPLSDYFGRN